MDEAVETYGLAELADVEITPEMMEAAVKILQWYYLDLRDAVEGVKEAVATELFQAMVALWPERP